MKRAFAVLVASALVSLAGSAALLGQEKAAAAGPWLKLTGTDRTCLRVETGTGGRQCVEYIDNERLFTLSKAGKGAQTIETLEHRTGQANRETTTQRGGPISSLEIRALRTYLASIDVAHLRGQCNAFQASQTFDPVTAPANFFLTWYGANNTTNVIDVGTSYAGVACSPQLLRLINRINRIAATLPEKPQR